MFLGAALGLTVSVFRAVRVFVPSLPVVATRNSCCLLVQFARFARSLVKDGVPAAVTCGFVGEAWFGGLFCFVTIVLQCRYHPFGGWWDVSAYWGGGVYAA